MMRVPSLVSAIFLLISGFFPSLDAAGVTYRLVDSIAGEKFYDAFTWEAIPDPTHGRVKYVDMKTSKALNLTIATNDTFILRAEHTKKLNPFGPGRKSVRIRSKRSYSKHVAIFDIRHMPEGCATWPAIWELASSIWPDGGEVDIVEGANDQSPNAATLHTSKGCTMPRLRNQKGTTESLNCASSSANNTGCGVKFRSHNSFGPAFNRGGGGWYALERSASSIKVWFWSRKDKTVPNNVKTNASSVNPGIEWGMPSASFPIVSKAIKGGDWADATYSLSGCYGTCIDQVNNHPEAFSAAFFNITSIRVYM